MASPAASASSRSRGVRLRGARERGRGKRKRRRGVTGGKARNQKEGSGLISREMVCVDSWCRKSNTARMALYVRSGPHAAGGMRTSAIPCWIALRRPIRILTAILLWNVSTSHTLLLLQFFYFFFKCEIGWSTVKTYYSCFIFRIFLPSQTRVRVQLVPTIYHSSCTKIFLSQN